MSVSIRLFYSELARLDFEHVAEGDLVYEILRRWGLRRRGSEDKKATSAYSAALIRAFLLPAERSASTQVKCRFPSLVPGSSAHFPRQ
jgi:hypothetical protein